MAPLVSKYPSDDEQGTSFVKTTKKHYFPQRPRPLWFSKYSGHEKDTYFVKEKKKFHRTRPLSSQMSRWRWTRQWFLKKRQFFLTRCGACESQSFENMNKTHISTHLFWKTHISIFLSKRDTSFFHFFHFFPPQDAAPLSLKVSSTWKRHIFRKQIWMISWSVVFVRWGGKWGGEGGKKKIPMYSIYLNNVMDHLLFKKKMRGKIKRFQNIREFWMMSWSVILVRWWGTKKRGKGN